MRIRRIFTTRAGGVSPAPYDSFNLAHHVGDDDSVVQANRRRLASELALTENSIVWMDQVHSTSIVQVDGTEQGPISKTDGLVTAKPGIALAVLTADCVPVLLGDPTTGVVSAVHAGRVGAQNGVILTALDAMCAAGARKDAIEAVLGPAICGKCYEVPTRMAEEVERTLPGSATATPQGSTGLDIRAGLWNQLANAGIAKIGQDPRCTFEDPALFSYRRANTTGRLAGLTWAEAV